MPSGPCYADVQGPTLTMKIHKYSLMKDVTATQNKPRMPDTLWQVSQICNVLSGVNMACNFALKQKKIVILLFHLSHLTYTLTLRFSSAHAVRRTH